MIINTLHEQLYTLISAITDFNQGFHEKPKEITDEKLPAFAVYFLGYENEFLTSRNNKRPFQFQIDIIYDKENLDVTRTVVSDLVSKVVDVLEAPANITLGGNCNFTEPTTCKRDEDYPIAGKHYLAYSIIINCVATS